MKNMFIIILAGLIAGCSSERDNNVQKLIDPNLLTLSAEMDKGVETGHPVVQDAKEELLLTGKVDFNPNMVTKVYSLVNGTIVNVRVNQGARVRKGEVLAEIYSSDFATAVSDFEKAKAQFKTAQKNLARAQELADAKILSQRELQLAVNDSTQAKAELDRAGRVLDLLNGSSESSSSTLKIVAPIDGMVLERFAQIGSQVRSDNSQNLFTIGIIKNVWVTLDVYQDQLQKINVGDKVALKFDGYNDTTIVTTISYITPVIDQVTMTAKARCEVENSNGLLKPAMFCSAEVFHVKGKGIFVPAASALYDGDGKTYIFAKLDTGKYQKREVHVGKRFSDYVEVLSGVTPRETIVTNQAIFLNEELESSAK
jgi:cobalt-zinc-cadmium efflux system membrane fusion protein